jgi:adenine-specific DNA-methyltransferase
MATGISRNQWNIKNNGGDEDFSNLGIDISLTYEGKLPESEILESETVSCINLGTLGEDINHLFYGDNLPILASFLNNSNIRGQIKLVYIDPPFATKSVFKSRSQKDAYTDLLAGSHYLEFIRRRLVIIRELLADDGSIYIHLDDNMAFHMKVIMDEIFGQRNFRNWITRKKCNPKNYTKKTFGNISDYILFYTKSDNYTWNRPFHQWTNDKAVKEYSYIEPITGRRYKKVPIHAPGTRNGETGKSWRGMNPPPGKHWQYIPKTLDEMDARGEIYWSENGNPRRKVYLDESSGIPVQDIWLEFRDAHNQNIAITGYPTEKNPALLSQIIQASSNVGDLVLDCFSGSGTTLATASQLERKWIGIDDSSEAISTTLRRFAQGCQPMGDFVTKRDDSNKNKLDNQLEQLSLFDIHELSEASNLKSNINKYEVKNFSLHAIESRAQELNSILTQWF